MDLLQQLVNALGPSGNETHIRKVIMHEIKPYVDEMNIDKMGNLICRKKGTGSKVMLAAHMDEIGLMVKEVRENGRIYFALIGGIEPHTLIAQRVAVMNHSGEVVCHGVVTFFELHEDREVKEMPKVEDLYVDCGVNKKELLKMGIDVGSYMVPTHQLHVLSDSCVSGKAMDNRVGCYILIKLAQRLKSVAKDDIYYVFTVQEEIGLYGAQTSVYTIDPAWGIAVDTTSAEDSEEPAYTTLGAGPALILMDTEIITNRCLNDHLISLAKKHNIPLQRRVETVGTTDASKLMMSKGGVPTTIVAVPLRNIHSTVTVANTNDIKNAIDLLYHMMRNPPKICLV